MQSVDPGQASQQQSDTQSDCGCHNQHPQCGLTTAAQREPQAETDHRTSAGAVVATTPSRTMTSRSA